MTTDYSNLSPSAQRRKLSEDMDVLLERAEQLGKTLRGFPQAIEKEKQRAAKVTAAKEALAQAEERARRSPSDTHIAQVLDAKRALHALEPPAQPTPRDAPTTSGPRLFCSIDMVPLGPDGKCPVCGRPGGIDPFAGMKDARAKLLPHLR